jgi:hypothetical protein
VNECLHCCTSVLDVFLLRVGDAGGGLVVAVLAIGYSDQEWCANLTWLATNEDVSAG